MSSTDWLSHLTVVEAGASPAARYCGWLFVQSGARVLQVGDAGAGQAALGQLTDAATDFLDTGKEQVAVAPAAADVQIVDGAVAPESTVAARVTGVVDVFGAGGPRSEWVADELVLAALGGAALYTRGRRGEPVYGFGYRYQYLAGLYLHTALVAELGANTTPTGHEVRVSALQTVASLLPYATTQVAYNGSESILEQSGPRFVAACIDGWVVVYAGLAWTALVGMLERPDLAEDPRFVALDERFAHVTELDALFQEWGSTRSTETALTLAGQFDVAATVVRSPADVLADDELRDRGLWHDVRGGGLAPSLPCLVISEGVADAIPA